ncbi:hypothetical protein ERO13_A12G023901v2 [Gossypium hirsutum]|nr:hypothetical protein ERO13_A12G023901v2 [Gossypium hirsutum]
MPEASEVSQNGTRRLASREKLPRSASTSPGSLLRTAVPISMVANLTRAVNRMASTTNRALARRQWVK